MGQSGKVRQREHPTSAERRRQVEQHLARYGLGRPRFFRVVRAEEHEERTIFRLRRALLDLGPVFSAFGLYLSSRIDLLSEQDCAVLASLGDHGPETPFETLAEFLAVQFGRPLADVLPDFEPRPITSTLSYQCHEARLGNGEAVVVQVVHPEFWAQLAEDLEHLQVLEAALSPGAPGEELDLPFSEVLADFRRAILSALDFDQVARALQALNHEARTSGLLRAPRVNRDLSSGRVLIRENLSGKTLAELLFASGGEEAPSGTSLPGGYTEELAIRLCQIWLCQALMGRCFPVDVRSENVVILANDQIAWTGGGFASLPPDAKVNLWEYLAAAAGHDPDRACSALVKELIGPVGQEEALRHRFHQAFPFRDGGPGASDDLAGYLFLHWRLATEHGYKPRPHLVHFYRGLAQLSVLARRLAWHRDPLREGLEGARLMAGLGEYSQLFDPTHLRQTFDTSVTTMMQLPQKLDEILNQLSQGHTNLKIQMIEPPVARQRKDTSAITIAVLFAMVATVLVTHQLEEAALFGAWRERISTAVLVILGLFLLRVMVRK